MTSSDRPGFARVADLSNALAGTAVFALGVPVYFLWNAARRRGVAP